MSDINTATFTGNLTSDVELRYTPKGTAVADITVANNTGFGDSEKTAFLGVTVWGKNAENLARYCGRGSKIGVTAEIIQDRWEDKGSKRSKTKFRAVSIVFLNTKPPAQPPAEREPQQSAQAHPQDEPFVPDEEDDDIPF